MDDGPGTAGAVGVGAGVGADVAHGSAGFRWPGKGGVGSGAGGGGKVLKADCLLFEHAVTLRTSHTASDNDVLLPPCMSGSHAAE